MPNRNTFEHRERKGFEMKNKIERLIKEKESKLNVYVLEKSLDSKRNLHVLCKVEADGSYTCLVQNKNTEFCNEKYRA